MKKMLVISVIPFFLSGCFGGDDDPTAPKTIEGYKFYETSEFSLQVPEEWEILTSINFQSDVPKNTVVAFRDNMKNAKFTANIAVVRNEIPLEISTVDYTKALREKTQNRLLNSKEITIEEAKIFVGDTETDTLFIHLQGRDQPQTDLKHYMQTSGVKENTAFIAIGAYLDSSNQGLEEKIEESIKSFRIK